MFVFSGLLVVGMEICGGWYVTVLHRESLKANIENAPHPPPPAPAPHPLQLPMTVLKTAATRVSFNWHRC